jgi:uncharacterized protein YqhQ
MNFLSVQKEAFIGGSAVIEGVMMRTSSAYVVACRKSDGSIIHKGEIVPKWCEAYKPLSLPIIRGCVALLQSMVIGIKALDFSARVFEGGLKENIEQKNKVVSAVFSALSFNIFLFIIIPFFLTFGLFVYLGWTEITLWDSFKAPSWIIFNLFDGAFRIVLFLLMIFLMAFFRDIKRMFQYHGAEHKTVSAWEKGLSLTIENAKREPRQHPRCGTSFLLLVMIVFMILSLPISFDSVWMNLLARIMLLPVVVGISFEIIRYVSKKESGLLSSIFVLPGLWLQSITTQEPDEKQLEVAIFSLKKSLELESRELKENA